MPRCRCESCANVSASRYIYQVSADIPKILENKQEDVPDGISRAEPDPLGDRSVLLLCARKLLLGPEGFVAL